jgi:hypothetical protein
MNAQIVTPLKLSSYSSIEIQSIIVHCSKEEFMSLIPECIELIVEWNKSMPLAR